MTALGLTQAFFFYSFVVCAQDIERARQLFEQASTLRESGHYADALVRLRLAIAIKDTPGLEYHAGFCEAKLGHYTKAVAHYEQAAVLIRAGADAPDVAALLNEAHKSATEHIAHVRVLLTQTVPNATLRVDGEMPLALPHEELKLDPGAHQLRAEAPGYSTEVRDINLRDAEELQVELNLLPLAHPAGSSQSSPARAFSWRTASIGTGLGVTLLGLGTGIVAAVGHHNASVSERAARDGGPAQSAQLAAAVHDKQTYATWETVGFVSAGFGAVATLGLWALWPSSQNVTVTAASSSADACTARLAFTSNF